MNQTLKNNTDFKTEIFSDDNSSYSFFLLYQEEKFYMKLTQKFNPTFWENTFSLNSLVSENKKWGFFEDDYEFFSRFVKALEEKTVTIQKKMDVPKCIQIKIDMKTYILPLNVKKGDQSQTIEDMVKHIINLEDEIANLKKIVQKGDVPFNSFSFITGNNNGYYAFSNKNKTVEKISGGNGRCGFRCDPPAKISNQMAFSIKIDQNGISDKIKKKWLSESESERPKKKSKYAKGSGSESESEYPTSNELAENLNNENRNIMVGWCMKNANHSKGYYKTNASFAWYLYNGKFYNRGACSNFVNQSIDPKNQIYTVIIDVKFKMFLVLLNGYLLGSPRGIELQDEEIGLLCPFVDIYYEGDKVSIVDFKKLKTPSFLLE